MNRNDRIILANLALEVGDEFEVMAARRIYPCRTCDNRARYDSGYCGVCDITHNEGKGKRL